MQVLDNPVGQALSTRQRHFAQASQGAVRFPSAIGPFAALPTDSAEAWAGLARLQTESGPVVLIGAEELAVPPDWSVAARLLLPQMTWAGRALARIEEAVELGPDDVEEMLALTRLTKPGPFGSRTHELGRYVGIRRGGRLVAMAGERFKPPGYTEVSAVCTHPDAAGEGLAAGLVGLVVERILADGCVPFLHVHPDNGRAIALYRRLGFQERRRLHFTVVRHGVADGDGGEDSPPTP